MSPFTLALVLITITAPIINEFPRTDRVTENSTINCVATTNVEQPAGPLNTNSSLASKPPRQQPPGVVGPLAAPNLANNMPGSISKPVGFPMRQAGTPAPGKTVTSPLMRAIPKTGQAPRPIMAKPLPKQRP